MNRRTSVYTLHLDTPQQAQEIAARFDHPIQDQGENSISFRTSDDTTALRIVGDTLSDAPFGWSLSTGLGIHRRWVA